MVIRIIKIPVGSSLPGLIKTLHVEWLEPGYAAKAMLVFLRAGPLESHQVNKTPWLALLESAEAFK